MFVKTFSGSVGKTAGKSRGHHWRPALARSGDEATPT